MCPTLRWPICGRSSAAPQTDAQVLAAIGEKIRQVVSATSVELTAAGASLCFAVSVGIAAFHADSDSSETLVARADAALYRAKERGRNQVELER